MEKKKIGILGGMGPLATVELFKRIVENTESYDDKGHIRIFIDNNPQIPDRTESILSNGASPVPELVSSAQILEQMGADFIVIPCNTSHYYIAKIQEKVNIDIVNMIDETAKYLLKNQFSKVGILATSGTIKSGVYSECLRKYGIECIIPEEIQQKEIMRFIYEGIKAGNRDIDICSINKIIEAMYQQGAQTVIMGCTELSVGVREFDLCNKYTDALEILACVAIEKAGYAKIK